MAQLVQDMELNLTRSCSKVIVTRRDVIYCVIIFLATFLIYAWSAPRTVVLEDDGFFILAGYFNGIAHPPGYPLYTLLAHAATLIPVGSVALRVHLLSGLLGALACVCLWRIAYLLLQDRLVAGVAALSLGFSRVYWSQAIIAEVYTFNVLLVLGVLWAALAVREAGEGQQRDAWVRLLYLCYGLALSNHWPLVILSTPMFVAVLWQVRHQFLSCIRTGLPFLLLGLTPYLWMWFRSQMNPEIMFFGPIESFHDFWDYLRRKPYMEIDYSASAGWSDKLQFMRYALIQTGVQFGPLGWLLVLSGAIVQWCRLPRDLCAALLLGFLGSSVALSLVMGFDYDGYHEIIFQVYPLVSFAVAAMWLGFGLEFLIDWLKGKKAFNTQGKIIPVSLGLLLVLSILLSNIPWNMRRYDNWARVYAETVLSSLSPGSILFLDGLAEGALAYLNKIEGYRDDVTLYSVRGVLFSNRLFSQLHPETMQAVKAIDEFISNQTRTIYYISNLMHEYGVEDYGLYFQVQKTMNQGMAHGMLSPHVLAYWEYVLTAEPHEAWTKIHRQTLMSDGCYFLTRLEKTNKQAASGNDKIMELHTRLCNNLEGGYIK